MDAIKRTGASTDGEPSLGIDLPEEPKQTEFFDIDGDEDEELATPKEADGPDDTLKVLQKEIRTFRGDRSELQGCVEETARAAELERELSRTQEKLTIVSLEAEDARANAESLSLAFKALEADKASLDARFRDMVARMADLQSEKEKAADEALKTEGELRSVRQEWKLDLEKAIATAKEKDADLFSIKEQLKKCNQEVEMERNRAKALALKKEEELAALKKELYVVREMAKDKEHPGHATMDARRMEELEKEVKQLKDVNFELEGKVKELQFQIDGDMLIQNSRKANSAEEEGPKISWAATFAAATSSGAIAAAITAFCLLQRRQR